jgi:hypothetical protein
MELHTHTHTQLHTLKTVPEIDSGSENNNNENDNGKLCIELTFYPDTLPSIKSYYLMTPTEYEELKTLHLDLFIENFINDEDLTKEKLDIYLINNSNNIKTIKNFINQFGNPFDIINYINAKQSIQKQLNKIKIQEKSMVESIVDNFSESESETESSSHRIEDVSKFINNKPRLSEFSNSVLHKCSEYSSKTSKPSKIYVKEADSDSDSESYIDTVTEIIDSYNKLKKVDNDKLEKISKNRPDLLKDAILNELTSKQTNKNVI